MTVKKLIQELQKCPEDLEVFTKRTELETVGVSSNVYVDTYGFLGDDVACVIISDLPNTETPEEDRKLKPCPFCGSKVIIEEHPEWGWFKYEVKCTNTDCGCALTNAYYSIEAATKDWNKRAKT